MIVTSPGVGVVDGGQRGEDRGEDGLDHDRGDQEPLAGEPVGERAADQPGEGAGHERGGRDDPGPARLVGLLGDEDPDADRLHPGADVGDERAEPEPRCRSVAKWRE